MTKCNACGTSYAYFPLMGPVECINEYCDFYNENHYQAMSKQYLNEGQEKVFQEVKCSDDQMNIEFTYDEGDDGDVHTPGWSPYTDLPSYGNVWKAYPSPKKP